MQAAMFKELTASIATGADVNRPVQSGSSKTALHVAAACGDLKCLDLLLGANADVLRFDADNRCPLALACMHGQGEAVSRLLAATAPKHLRPLLGVPDENGWTCLHHAVSGGSLRAVEELLRAGAGDLRTGTGACAREKTGRTPFHLAASVRRETQPPTPEPSPSPQPHP
jgi:ankyrin repeat protein